MRLRRALLLLREDCSELPSLRQLLVDSVSPPRRRPLLEEDCLAEVSPMLFLAATELTSSSCIILQEADLVNPPLHKEREPLSRLTRLRR